MELLRALPSVHELVEDARGQSLVRQHGRSLVLFAIQRSLNRERAEGRPSPSEARWKQIAVEIERLRTPRLRRLINATGVILHTNLGRAVLAPSAAAAAAAVGQRYSNLELDLETGKRGSRHDLVSDLLCHLTGADAAAVVNNCAAATLLMLTALTRGKEVIVSRGELVEIGGGFRMPDVMRLSGARMVEVGTTNRTRLDDYARALGPKTAAVLKVHASNFQVVGFAESASVAALAGLAHQHEVLLLHDLGSGALLDSTRLGLAPEPRITESLSDGADLVVCSADKLLGGPQAGLMLGRAPLVSRVLKHPLARAVRVDKMTLAALAATLDLYLSQAEPAVPVWEMLRLSSPALEARARRWADWLSREGVPAEVRPGASTIGGGSLPGEILPTTLVALRPTRPGPAALLDRLRSQDLPIIARIDEGCVVLDPRTVLPDEDEALLEGVRAAVHPAAGS